MEKTEIDRFAGINNGAGLLKEIRCKEKPQHRLRAAELLLQHPGLPENISYLCNMVLYDPDPMVKAQIRGLLHEKYGNELENILRVEAIGGQPIETPWMLSCQLKTKPQPIDQDILDCIIRQDYASLRAYLQDPKDVRRRLLAAKSLAKDPAEQTLELLAKSVLFDPEEAVQQQSYQSLYEAGGKEKADLLLDEIGANSFDEIEGWLPEVEEFDDDQDLTETDVQRDESLFGISKADRLRGMVNLLTGEENPQKRLTLLKALEDSKDFNANDVIARVALFDSDVEVRKTARSILENRLGDQMGSYLALIYDTYSTYHPDPDFEEDEMMASPSKSVEEDEFRSQLRNQPSVIEEGNTRFPLWLISAVIIFALILFFILQN